MRGPARRPHLLSLLALAPWLTSDHARGLQLLAEGKFADAAVAFRAAAEADPTNAELHYNLALALWRAGDANGAEIAAEKAATLSDGRLAPLRDGILGNLKIDEAHAKLGGEQPDLQAALGAAQKARDHFLHGAAVAGAPGELVRNLERALKLIAEIEKKIADQKQQQKDDKKDQQNKDDKNKDDKDKKDDKDQDGKQDDKSQPSDDSKDKQGDKDKDGKNDESKKAEDQKNDKSKPPEKPPEEQQDRKQDQPPGQGENKDKPEPKPQPDKDDPSKQQQQDAKPDDKGQAPQPQPGEQPDKPEPQPAPGEADKDKKTDQQQPQLGQPQPGRELSPEETKRLLDKLQVILQQKAELEKAQKAARPKVKKDW